MRQKYRLLLYSAVLVIPILSGIIYGAWSEIYPFIILVVVLALIIEVIYRKQGVK
jgi:hypothetical protein